MRKVYIDNPAQFHCPITGVLMWYDGPFRVSPATRFAYIESEQAFEFIDENFAKTVAKVARPYQMDVKEAAYFNELCRGLAKSNHIIDFQLHFDGNVVHIGIDASYDPE